MYDKQKNEEVYTTLTRLLFFVIQKLCRKQKIIQVHETIFFLFIDRINRSFECRQTIKKLHKN